MLPFQIIFIVKEPKVFRLHVFFGSLEVWWIKICMLSHFLQRNAIFSSIENSLPWFVQLSRLIDLGWRQWSSFLIVEIQLFARCRSYEILKRWLSIMLRGLSIVCNRHIAEIVIKIATLLLIWRVYEHILLGFFVLSKHWEVPLIKIELWSINLTLNLLIVDVWIIHFFIYFLFKAKVLPNILSWEMNFSMRLWLPIKSLVCILHIGENSIFLWIIQTHIWFKI